MTFARTAPSPSPSSRFPRAGAVLPTFLLPLLFLLSLLLILIMSPDAEGAPFTGLSSSSSSSADKGHGVHRHPAAPPLASWIYVLRGRSPPSSLGGDDWEPLFYAFVMTAGGALGLLVLFCAGLRRLIYHIGVRRRRVCRVAHTRAAAMF